MVKIDWFLFVFAEFLWYTGNWMLSTQFFNKNSFDEGFPCDNAGLARLPCVNIFQDSRPQWSTRQWSVSYVSICFYLKDSGELVVVVVIKLKVMNLIFLIKTL